MFKKILLVQFRKDERIASHERRCFSRKIKKLEFINIFKEDSSILRDNFSLFEKIILGGSGEFSLSEKESEKDLWERIKELQPLTEYMFCDIQ